MMVKRIVSVRMDSGLLAEIDKYAVLSGVDRSEFIRTAVKYYIREIKKLKPRPIKVKVVRLE